jgi:hypothetical protein
MEIALLQVRLIRRLKKCYFHTFRYMRTMARQRRLLRARSQMGSAYYRMKKLSGAIRVWIRQTHNISYRPKDARFKILRDASNMAQLNVGTSRVPLSSGTYRNSNSPDRNIRNVSYTRDPSVRRTVDLSARRAGPGPLDSSVRTEWAQMERSGRFSEFDISAVSGNETFVMDSDKIGLGYVKNSKLFIKMRRKFSKLLENRMKVRLLEIIRARYVQSIAVHFPVRSEYRADLFCIFSSQRRGLYALFRHAYCVQTMRLCRLKLELRPIFRSWKSVYKRRISLQKHLKSITVRILVRILRGTFNAWSLFTLKQIRLRTQAATLAARSQHYVLLYSWQAWLQSRRERELTVLSHLVVQLRERKIVARMLRRWKRAKMINRIVPDALKETTFAAWVRYVQMRREKKSFVSRGEKYFLLSKLNGAFHTWYQKTCEVIWRKQRAESAILHVCYKKSHEVLNSWAHKTQRNRDIKKKPFAELSPIATPVPSVQTPQPSEYDNTSRVSQPSRQYLSPLSSPVAQSVGSKLERSFQRQVYTPASGTQRFASKNPVPHSFGSKVENSFKVQVADYPVLGTQRKARLPSHLSKTTPRRSEMPKESRVEFLMENKISERLNDTTTRPTPLATPVPRAINVEPEALPAPPARRASLVSPIAASGNSELAQFNTPSVLLNVNPTGTSGSSQLTTIYTNHSSKSEFDEFFGIWSNFALSRAFKKWAR